jgi:hypothetical protein
MVDEHEQRTFDNAWFPMIPQELDDAVAHAIRRRAGAGLACG